MKLFWKRYKEGGFNRAHQLCFVLSKTGCLMKFELEAPQRTTEHTEKLKTIVEITKRNNTGICCS